jgi:Cu/Ag efflux protein CusF
MARGQLTAIHQFLEEANPMKKLLLSLAVATALGTVLTPAMSKDGSGAAVVASSKPGTATVTEVIRLTGTVVSIDAANHRAVIKGSNGKVIPLDIGPEARNLEQVKVGDKVTVRYSQALTLTLMKDGKEIRSKTEEMSGVRTKAGERPGGAIGREIEVTADVTKVNTKTKTITLRGPEHSLDLKVQDPAQLKLIKVGDQVHATYVEAVALAVE